MEQLKAGFARTDITPAVGTPMHGYYEPRYASGVLDPIQADVLAVSEGSTALLISLDLCEFCDDVIMHLRKEIAQATGIGVDAIMIAATHNHTGPCLLSEEGAKGYTMFGVPFNEMHLQLLRDYRNQLTEKLVCAAMAAVADLMPARLLTGTAECVGVSFVRRFLMKDGSIRTNPGIGNPDIVQSLGKPDTQLCALQLQRETDCIIIAHFGNHADTVGGDQISADWPGVMRRNVEQAIPQSKCMYFNGGEGNINHFDAMLTNSEYAAYLCEHKDIFAAARYCGGKCAKAVLAALETASLAQKTAVRVGNLTFLYPAKDCAGEIAMPLMGVAVGEVAFVSIPGEPFAETAAAIKENEGWRMVLPCSLSNGFLDYFPTVDALDGSSYEARSCRFRPGIAEKIEQNSRNLLRKLACVA